MKKSGITVVGVEATNFHRLTFAQVRLIPGEGLVRVTGKNGAGKTSLLRSIRAALGGASEVLPEPVNAGAEDKTGIVRLTLSNGFTVTRRFTEAQPKGYLTVEGADGGKHSQTKLAEWLGPLSFDPLAFFDLKPERQREILLSLGGDPELPAKLDRLRRSRANKYEERTPWISQKRRAGQVARPGGERPVPVDVSGELARMGELQAAERARADVRRAVDDAQRAIAAATEGVAEVDRKIAELQEQLRRAQALREARASRVEELRAELAEAEQAFAGTTDPAAEMEEVRARVAQSDSVLAAIEPWKAWERAQAELAEATFKIAALEKDMATLEEMEAALIATAGIPVEGLGFSGDGAPLLNGRPLAVASGAERIRLAVGVALAANPDLRVALVDEANDIDLEGLTALDELARAHGFQVWAARIGLEGPGEIVVEDGKARARGVAAAAV